MVFRPETRNGAREPFSRDEEIAVSPGRNRCLPLERGLRSQGPEFKSPPGRSFLAVALTERLLRHSRPGVPCARFARAGLRQDAFPTTMTTSVASGTCCRKRRRGDLSRRVAAAEQSETARLREFKSPEEHRSPVPNYSLRSSLDSARTRSESYITSKNTAPYPYNSTEPQSRDSRTSQLSLTS